MVREVELGTRPAPPAPAPVSARVPAPARAAPAAPLPELAPPQQAEALLEEQRRLGNTEVQRALAARAGEREAPPPAARPRDLERVFRDALEDWVRPLPLPRRLRSVRVAAVDPSDVLIYLVENGRLTLRPEERALGVADLRGRFARATAAFARDQREAIQRELIADPVKGADLWAAVLDQFKHAPEQLNQAPFEGLKDQVEDALLTAYAARAEPAPSRKPPRPGRESGIEAMRDALANLRHQTMEAYQGGIETWRIPEEASFDWTALEAGAGTAASGAGSVFTALPGMAVLGMEATAGVGFAVGTLGVGLIIAGTAAAVYAVYQHAKAAKEENRRQIIEAGIKRELLHTTAAAMDRLHAHEDFLVVTLAMAAEKEGLSAASPRPVWEAFVWRKLAPRFPTSLDAGISYVAELMRKSFDAAFEKK